MAEEDYLLHPNLVASIPFANLLTTRLLDRRIRETLTDDLSNDPSVSVVVRTLNEATKLQQLLNDIKRQVFAADVEILIVDNESTDRTHEVAKEYDAEVVTLQRKDFTYSKSMNLGMEAASCDLVFLTVGHARLSNVYNLHAGARHFSKNDGVAGAFGTVLPGVEASQIERWGTALDTNRGLVRPARRVKKATWGVLAGTGAMFSKSAWKELGRFDERYETGGEDTALAKVMLAKGYGVIQEPALTVHHSHGLGLKDSAKQLIHQFETLRAPRQFDRQKLLVRRPDLRVEES